MRAAGRWVERPQLLRVYLNKGTFAVYRLDRRARSTAEAVTILNQLNALGIEFKSLTEAIDTTKPGRVVSKWTTSTRPTRRPLNADMRSFTR